jgi:hypothetical protein
MIPSSPNRYQCLIRVLEYDGKEEKKVNNHSKDKEMGLQMDPPS